MSEEKRWSLRGFLGGLFLKGVLYIEEGQREVREMEEEGRHVVVN
jgi:hypothetical protein